MEVPNPRGIANVRSAVDALTRKQRGATGSKSTPFPLGFESTEPVVEESPGARVRDIGYALLRKRPVPSAATRFGEDNVFHVRVGVGLRQRREVQIVCRTASS